MMTFSEVLVVIFAPSAVAVRAAQSTSSFFVMSAFATASNERLEPSLPSHTLQRRDRLSQEREERGVTPEVRQALGMLTHVPFVSVIVERAFVVAPPFRFMFTR